MNNTNPVSQFLLDCEIRGLQPVSIKSYKEKLGAYFKDYTLEDINQFILDKRRAGIHTATINSYLIALRAYMNWAEIPCNIKLLKKEETVKDIYTTEEITALIKKPKSFSSFNEMKIWALVCFLIGTGCRISTALEIKTEDVDLEGGYVLFHHMKNHRQQYFPISKALRGVLLQYMKTRGEGYLFCNSYGEKADLRTIQEQVARYNNSRGVQKTSCHLFRHTFAANYVRKGGDIYRLQHLLGHQTLEMSAHYVQLYGSDYGRNLDELCLLDNCTKTKIRL